MPDSIFRMALVAIALLSGAASQRLARLIGQQQEVGSVILQSGSRQPAGQGIDRQPPDLLSGDLPPAIAWLRPAMAVRSCPAAVPALERLAAGEGRRPGPLEIEAAEMAGDIHRLANEMEPGHGSGFHRLG